jgi:hypothetical protein
MENFFLCAKEGERGGGVFKNGLVFSLLKYSALAAFHKAVYGKRRLGVKGMV